MRVGALAAALVVAAGLGFSQAAQELRESATDLMMRVWPRREVAPSQVLAVAITDADLLTTPWPWPRALLARLVGRLAEDGAAAIAIDIALSESADGDSALQAALAGIPGIVAVLEGPRATPHGIAVALLGAPDIGGLAVLRGIEPQALPGIPGGFAALPGRTVRAVPMLTRVEAPPGDGATPIILPGLAVGALAQALGVDTLLLRAGNPALLQFRQVALPMTPDGLLRLDPPMRAVPMTAAEAVLSGASTQSAAGRIVVLGVTAASVAPLRPSAFGAFTPSLQIQAEAVAQLIAGWVPQRVPGGGGSEAAAGLLLGVLAAWAVRRAPGPGLLLTLGLALLWPAGALATLRLGAVLVDPALPACAVLAGGLAEAAASARRLAVERARLLSRFSHRLPTGVADQLLALPSAERLRPERCQVAVVMTDLAGFSAMVRDAEPGRLVALLNSYLAGIETAVLEQGGTLERLIGDSVLAVFGAPVPLPGHARRALAAARAIDDFAEAFRQRPDAVAVGWGETRMGVTAGEVLAGELGGSRLTWSVCGDAANIAARLQELGKVVGRRALVAGIEDPTLPPPLGHFALRGLPGEVTVSPLN